MQFLTVQCEHTRYNFHTKLVLYLFEHLCRCGICLLFEIIDASPLYEELYIYILLLRRAHVYLSATKISINLESITHTISLYTERSTYNRII